MLGGQIGLCSHLPLLQKPSKHLGISAIALQSVFCVQPLDDELLLEEEIPLELDEEELEEELLLDELEEDDELLLEDEELDDDELLEEDEQTNIEVRQPLLPGV